MNLAQHEAERTARRILQLFIGWLIGTIATLLALDYLSAPTGQPQTHPSPHHTHP
jgi:hypothetical protein